MKPKILTLEEITLSSSEDPLKLAQYDKSLDAELTYIREQLEAIENIGGVSQGYVAGVAPYLPEGVALESFTTKVSKHQYGIVTESLGTGMKLLIAAGAVAALGGVIYLLRRLGKGDSPQATPAGEKVRPAIQTAKKAQKVTETRVQQVRTVKPAGNTKSVEELLRDNPAVKDGKLIDVADYVAEQMLKDGSLTNMEVGILDGSWKYLGSQPDQKNYPEHFGKFHQFIWRIFDNLEKVVNKRENAKVSDVDLAEVGRFNKFMAKNPESFGKWFEHNSHQRIPDNMENLVDIGQFIRNWMSTEVPANDAGTAIAKFVKEDARNLDKPDPEGLVKRLDWGSNEAETLAKKFEVLGNRLEEVKLPVDVSDMVKTMIASLKDALGMCVAVRDMVKQEVEAYNRTVRATGRWSVSYTSECKKAVGLLAQYKQPDQPSNIQSQEELDKLMQSGDTFKL